MPEPRRTERSRARRLPITPATVTILGDAWGPRDYAWAGLRFDAATLREQSTAMVFMLGADRAPPDHHLDVPFCHPDDESGDDMVYRVRPRDPGYRFVKAQNGAWVLELANAPLRRDAADA